jgi:uncharacterized cupredoxin-like copper-binding protein
VKSAYVIAAIALVTGAITIEAMIFTLVVGLPTTTTSFAKVDLALNVTAGEIGTKYGFGLTGKAVSSPGPDMVLSQGKVVRINFRNEGQIPHTFKITSELRWDANAVFGSVVGEPSRPLSPGQGGVSTFRADRSGSYFYICSIPGHIDFGMFGRLIVEP